MLASRSVCIVNVTDAVFFSIPRCTSVIPFLCLRMSLRYTNINCPYVVRKKIQIPPRLVDTVQLYSMYSTFPVTFNDCLLTFT